MTYSCGIDEAGRGPVLGPMVLACVVVDDNGRAALQRHGVRDSKQLTPRRREELEPVVKDHAIEYKLAKIPADEIDRLRKTHSLNVLEAQKAAELILGLDTAPSRVYVDAVDTDNQAYREKIIHHIQKQHPDYRLPEIIAEHKADDKYIEVGAASILAKVERDCFMTELSHHYGEVGSGYPSDPTTMELLRRLIRDGPLPAFVRRSWETVNRGHQTTLEEYE